MNLSGLGDLGDFVGGLGVLATLIYLAIQIRQNTSEVRNSAVQRLLEQSTNIFSSELSLKANSIRHLPPQELTTADKDILQLFMRRNFQLFEQVYLQFVAGRIDEEIMDAYESRISGHFEMPFSKECWSRMRNTFTRRFVSYVDELWAEA